MINTLLPYYNKKTPNDKTKIILFTEIAHLFYEDYFIESIPEHDRYTFTILEIKQATKDTQTPLKLPIYHQLIPLLFTEQEQKALPIELYQGQEFYCFEIVSYLSGLSILELSYKNELRYHNQLVGGIGQQDRNMAFWERLTKEKHFNINIEGTVILCTQLTNPYQPNFNIEQKFKEEYLMIKKYAEYPELLYSDLTYFLFKILFI